MSIKNNKKISGKPRASSKAGMNARACL